MRARPSPSTRYRPRSWPSSGGRRSMIADQVADVGGRRLTVAEVARRLGVDPNLVARYCRERRPRATKPGRDWAVDGDDVDAFLPERRRQAAPRPPGRPPS